MVVNLVFRKLRTVLADDLAVEARHVLLADVLSPCPDLDGTVAIGKQLDQTIPLKEFVVIAVAVLQLPDVRFVAQPGNLLLQRRQFPEQCLDIGLSPWRAAS